jgi:hypothetical protein
MYTIEKSRGGPAQSIPALGVVMQLGSEAQEAAGRYHP